MEEDVSKDIEEAKPGTTPDLDEGDEVSFGVFAATVTSKTQEAFSNPTTAV